MGNTRIPAYLDEMGAEGAIGVFRVGGLGMRFPVGAAVTTGLQYLGEAHLLAVGIAQAAVGDFQIVAGRPGEGAVAAGGLVTAFDDAQEHLDLAPVLETRGLFALTVNGDSMVDSHIADAVAGDTPLYSLQVGTEDMGTAAGACDGFPCTFFNTLSWRDDVSPLPVSSSSHSPTNATGCRNMVTNIKGTRVRYIGPGIF